MNKYIKLLLKKNSPLLNKKNKKIKYKYTNELIYESSPYLLQHAHNPVNWYPWSEKSLEKAKNENKLLIISIGYAACHWCHVMEHESFEDIEIANYMNEHFICIKVDREERPDVDQIYMTAAQILSGSGGWPLNAFCLSNSKPFYAGTYFPKQNWLEILKYFVNIKQNKFQLLENQAHKITDGINNSETIVFEKEKKTSTIENINIIFNQWKVNIDFIKGGENRTPKFPMPSNWEYLLHYYFITKNIEALHAVTITLDNMAFGGIFDQLEGGFSRYSTDENWKAPHFEKMLYDNAQLVSLYCKAFQVNKNPLYKNIVTKTLNFISNELTDPNGGFYSALDADTDGEEGKYYVWSYIEIKKHLKNESDLFIDYFNILESGNWENGNNILFRNLNEEYLEEKYKLSKTQIENKIQKQIKKLLKIRQKRTKPKLDDKILTSWNGLMLNGYIEAYNTFGEEKYLKIAIKNAKFIRKNLINNNGELMRNFKNTTATINAFLDDYAFTISALISLYQTTFNEKYLYQAKELTDITIKYFFDNITGMFFYTHKLYSNLISRKMEITDNVIPSSNSEMAKNLFKLGKLFSNNEYSKISEQMLLNIKNDMHKNIRYYSNWGSLELQLILDTNEISIVGKNCINIKKKLALNYLPNTILLGSKTEGSLKILKHKLIKNKTIIYVCKNNTCKPPTSNVNEVLKQINNI